MKTNKYSLTVLAASLLMMGGVSLAQSAGQQSLKPDDSTSGSKTIGKGIDIIPINNKINIGLILNRTQNNKISTLKNALQTTAIDSRSEQTTGEVPCVVPSATNPVLSSGAGVMCGGVAVNCTVPADVVTPLCTSGPNNWYTRKLGACDAGGVAGYGAVMTVGSEGDCQSVPPPIAAVAQCCSAAQTVTWGAGCSAAVPAMTKNDGEKVTLVNTAAGYTGASTLTCGGGEFVPDAVGTCVAQVNSCPYSCVYIKQLNFETVYSCTTLATNVTALSLTGTGGPADLWMDCSAPSATNAPGSMANKMSSGTWGNYSTRSTSNPCLLNSSCPAAACEDGLSSVVNWALLGDFPANAGVSGTTTRKWSWSCGVSPVVYTHELEICGGKANSSSSVSACY